MPRLAVLIIARSIKVTNLQQHQQTIINCKTCLCSTVRLVAQPLELMCNMLSCSQKPVQYPGQYAMMFRSSYVLTSFPVFHEYMISLSLSTMTSYQYHTVNGKLYFYQPVDTSRCCPSGLKEMCSGTKLT